MLNDHKNVLRKIVRVDHIKRNGTRKQNSQWSYRYIIWIVQCKDIIKKFKLRSIALKVCNHKRPSSWSSVIRGYGFLLRPCETGQKMKKMATVMLTLSGMSCEATCQSWLTTKSFSSRQNGPLRYQISNTSEFQSSVWEKDHVSIYSFRRISPSGKTWEVNCIKDRGH